MTMSCWSLTQDRGSDIAAGEEEGEKEADFARRGITVGLASSHGFEEFEGDLESDVQKTFDPRAAVKVDGGDGLRGTLGYRCHRHFSAEVQVEWIESFDSKASGFDGAHIGDIDFEPIVITANAKGYLLTGRFQPFLLLGGGILTLDTTLKNRGGFGGTRDGSSREESFVVRVGGGLDVYATENIAIMLQGDYVIPTGALSDLDYGTLGIGVMYRF